jgi:transaldolase
LALEDLTRAAKLFQPIYERTQGLDGWVSLEVSPLIAYDTQTTVAEANRLYKAANTPNLFIKIPGTPEGIPAIEEAIFSGTPVNVTLLFSTEQYLASAEAWLRGVERRIEAGLNPDIRSVASVFVSRWDREAAAKAPEGFHNKLALAESMLTYQAYLEFLQSPRVLRVMNFGVKPQRLLWASTGTKDNTLSASHYVDTLVTPYTVNTIPESTLLAFADKGKVASALPTDGGDAQAVVAAFKAAGVDDHELATKLQVDGAAAFVKAWESLLAGIQSKI